jgi:DNA-binding transcriptional regulator YbjK
MPAHLTHLEDDGAGDLTTVYGALIERVDSRQALYGEAEARSRCGRRHLLRREWRNECQDRKKQRDNAQAECEWHRSRWRSGG